MPNSRNPWVKAALAAFALAAAASAQVVEGTVLNNVTGAGIQGVGINLEQVTTGAYRVYQVRTDASGQFRLDNVQDGVYRVLYATNDYWSADQDGQTRIQVSAGSKAVELEERLNPMPRLSGRVLDGNGKPVSKAQVFIEDSGLGMGLGMDIEADDAGHFDLKQRPGAVILWASAPPSWKPPAPDPETGQARVWALTFYPGGTRPESASKVVIQPGGDVSDLEWKLIAVPVHAVRGVLLSPEGKPEPRATVALGWPDPPSHVETGADGSFEFPSVPDGDWRLSSQVNALQGSQRIAMAGRDLEGIRLRLQAPFDLHGRVIVDVPQGTAPPRLPTVVLRSVDPDRETEATMLFSARPDADGNITFKHVYPGIYRLDDSVSPGLAYLDSVRLGDAGVPTLQMEIASGSAPLTMTYKMDGGTVRGAVEKCGHAEVLLLPADGALRLAGLVRSTRCEADRYEITGLRPGEYYALALTGDVSRPLPQRIWDDATLQQGQRVTVRAGEASTADLRAIPRPVY